MPELPEVETMCRGIRSIVGNVIFSVKDPGCDCRPMAISPSISSLHRRLRGRRIEQVSRLGKRVVLTFDAGYYLVFEPRMTGLVSLVDPPDWSHVRVRMEVETNQGIQAVWFWDRRGLGTLTGYDADELEARVRSKLGPDALEVGSEELTERFSTTRQAIKVALLDQRRLAGIGNLYAAEILHVAAIHPERTSDSLKTADWRRLHAAMRRVLEEAIRYEGSTLSDGTYRNALNQAGGYQNHHRVYARAGEPCGTCRKRIVERIVQAQRSTFFCPGCQPRRRRS